jgi:hypothetical protein
VGRMKRREFVGLATVSAAASVPVMSTMSRTALAGSRGVRERDDAVLMYWSGSEERDEPAHGSDDACLASVDLDVPAHEWVPATRLLMGDGQFRALDARVTIVGLRGRADEALSLDVVFPAKGLPVRPRFHAWQFDPNGLATSAAVAFDLPVDQEGAAELTFTRGPTSGSRVSNVRLTTGAMSRSARLRRGVYALGFGNNPTHNHIVFTVDYARPPVVEGL